MQRGAFPVTSEIAAARWQLRPSARDASLEVDDCELLRWVGSRADDPQALHSALFCRRYERTWMTADVAAKRVMCERGEVLGARVGSAVAVLCVPSASLLASGGTSTEVVGLVVALAIAGVFTLLWKGAPVLARVAILQAIAVAALLIGKLGFSTGVAVALYAPAALMAVAAVIGSRVGLSVARLAHARLHRRLPAVVDSRASRSRDAIAA